MNLDELTAHLLCRLREVQDRLGLPTTDDPSARFADVIDSMGLVELIGQLAADCAVRPEEIEAATGHHFRTVDDLARTLHVAGLIPRSAGRPGASLSLATAPTSWLISSAVHLPAGVQTAAELDRLLAHDPGWYASHTGIQSRRLWGEEDPLGGAVRAARKCLENVDHSPDRLTALLVTSEAPPRSIGLAAALHHHLGLPSAIPAIEIGGACVGLLAGLWLGQRLLASGGTVLILAVEAPSRWLTVQPGSAGETAALFGDAAAACLLAAQPAAPPGLALPLREVALAVHGEAAGVLHLAGTVEHPMVQMQGPALALRAVDLSAQAVLGITARQGLRLADLGGVYVHAGNGRLAALVARRLEMDEAKVHAETPRTGNLGSVSLLAAWAAQPCPGPVVWAAVGAGLLSGAALFVP